MLCVFARSMDSESHCRRAKIVQAAPQKRIVDAGFSRLCSWCHHDHDQLTGEREADQPRESQNLPGALHLGALALLKSAERNPSVAHAFSACLYTAMVVQHSSINKSLIARCSLSAKHHSMHIENHWSIKKKKHCIVRPQERYKIKKNMNIIPLPWKIPGFANAGMQLDPRHCEFRAPSSSSMNSKLCA